MSAMARTSAGVVHLYGHPGPPAYEPGPHSPQR